MNQKLDEVFEQSGVIPYRLKDGEIQVLLITSSNGQRWVIPKGQIESWMNSAESAAKEAWEEAGIIGHVDANAIGTYTYHKRGSLCRVEVFLMEVETMLENWPEALIRKRQWLSITQAVKRVEEAELKQILKSLPELPL